MIIEIFLKILDNVNVSSILIFVALFVISVVFLKLRDKIILNKYKSYQISVKNPKLPAYDNFEEISKDFLYRRLEEIKEIINRKDFNQSNILVEGAWGTGKTTLLKIIEQEFTKLGYIVLYLDLIGFSTSEDILRNLIREIALKFKYKWWQDLFEIFYLNFSLNIVGFNFLLDNNISITNKLNNFKDHVYKKIKDKKFVIIIDEMDRIVEKKVLLNTLKFINVFSRIPNLYVIAATDKKALFNLFKDEGEYIIDGYLKKTFDFEINVSPPRILLQQLLIEKLENLIKNYDCK
ncbi:MAG: P-loop NTPase fold protein [Candidatus Aenigmatarchaeota archaeon]